MDMSKCGALMEMSRVTYAILDIYELSVTSINVSGQSHSTPKLSIVSLQLHNTYVNSVQC